MAPEALTPPERDHGHHREAQQHGAKLGQGVRALDPEAPPVGFRERAALRWARRDVDGQVVAGWAKGTHGDGMSEIKGYVVRGKANDAPVFYVGDGDFVYAGVGDGETPKTLNTIGDSSYAVDSMDNGCTDVRIYAVAEDGAETPLPTYEEALTIVDLAGKERAAWARLVKAERRFHDQTDLLGERDDDAKGARTGVDDAAQALRDLGVDVDALLGDP